MRCGRHLAAEFLGDYVYAAASRTYGAAVWNDVRRASDCPEVDAYRQELHDIAVATGTQTAEAEEPRGAEGHDGSRAQEREVGPPPDDAWAPPVDDGWPSSAGHQPPIAKFEPATNRLTPAPPPWLWEPCHSEPELWDCD